MRGGIVPGLREVVDGGEDGVVDLNDFRRVGSREEEDVGLSEGFENLEGELFPGGETSIDQVEEGDLGVECLKWFFGDVEAETFRARLVNAREDVVVVTMAKPVSELFAIGFGEAGESGLDLWFSHRSGVRVGYCKGLQR